MAAWKQAPSTVWVLFVTPCMSRGHTQRILPFVLSVGFLSFEPLCTAQDCTKEHKIMYILLAQNNTQPHLQLNVIRIAPTRPPTDMHPRHAYHTY